MLRKLWGVLLGEKEEHKAPEPIFYVATGLDEFRVPSGDRLTVAHLKLNHLLEQFKAAEPVRYKGEMDLPFVQQALDVPRPQQLELAAAAAERELARIERWRSKIEERRRGIDVENYWGFGRLYQGILETVLRRRLPLDRSLFQPLAVSLSKLVQLGRARYLPLPYFLHRLEEYQSERGLPPEMRAALDDMHAALLSRFNNTVRLRKISRDLGDILDGKAEFPVEAGSAWRDALRQDLRDLDGAESEQWQALVELAAEATSASPSRRWTRRCRKLITRLGEEHVWEQLQRWLSLALQPEDETMPDPASNVLRGLVWMVPKVADESVIPLLTDLAVECYRKIPYGGPRSERAGNACLVALGEYGSERAAEALGRFQIEVGYEHGRRIANAQLDRIAKSKGLPVKDLIEISVPDFDLGADGMSEKTVGNYRAQLRLKASSSAELIWINQTGRELKGVPAAIRNEHKQTLQELRQECEQMRKVLSAQRKRLESLYLAPRSWHLATWRERFIDHPLIGPMTQALIWSITEGNQSHDVIWHEGRLQDHRGREIEPASDAEVQLWHPIDASPQQVLAWRRWLEASDIVQPFKQAHREIYILTEAERQSGEQSLRFAGHILNLKQFRGLRQAREWKYDRWGGWDAYYDAGKELDHWDLYAYFKTEGIFESDLIGHLGIPLFVHSGAVEFLDAEEQPVLLEQVPKRVFSEIMRDVDLFVGVASIGVDPNWPNREDEPIPFMEYWRRFALGELGERGSTRKELLASLVPQLAIADQCRLQGRFLHIEGRLRRYKIHLGSGNVLMSPNNQFLCVVADKAALYPRRHSGVRLPFEGDALLSIILSKAFLLASDDEIEDPIIRSQIRSN